MRSSMLEPVGRYVITLPGSFGSVEPGSVLFCAGIMLRDGVPVYYLSRPGRSSRIKATRSTFDLLPPEYTPGAAA